MKIHPDQIEGVRQSQEQQKANKTESPQQAFGDVLGQEVSKAGATEGSEAVAPPPGLTVNPLLAPQAVSAVAPSVEEGQAMAQVESALDSLETYATTLGGTESGDLKQAYAALESFQTDVAGLKDAAQDSPELQGMVDELEVLAMTEQMKFNRGDYL